MKAKKVQNKQPSLANIRVAIDVVVFTVLNDKLCILLLQRDREPYKNQLALPGGFIWQDEQSIGTAKRILKDKAAVEGVFIEQLFTFDEIKRDPRDRVISITYYALVSADNFKDQKNLKTKNATIVPLEECKNLAFDHDHIVEYALQRLRSKVLYTNSVYSLLPAQFTFAQLQHIYEIILNQKLDKRNFRKKYLSLSLIEPTGESLVGQKYRPAALYRFVKTTTAELSSPFIK